MEMTHPTTADKGEQECREAFEIFAKTERMPLHRIEFGSLCGEYAETVTEYAWRGFKSSWNRRPNCEQQLTANEGQDGLIEEHQIAHEIALILAEIDGYDTSDLSGGLFDLRWSGGSCPEPLGDHFSLEYLPKGERIARHLSIKQPK